MIAIYDKIIIRLNKSEDKTNVSGIVTSVSSSKNKNIETGTIVSIGRYYYDNDNDSYDYNIGFGKSVAIGVYSGVPVSKDGANYKVITSDDILYIEE